MSFLILKDIKLFTTFFQLWTKDHIHENRYKKVIVFLPIFVS
jgi:hypothetical protein